MLDKLINMNPENESSFKEFFEYLNLMSTDIDKNKMSTNIDKNKYYYNKYLKYKNKYLSLKSLKNM